MKKTNGTDCWDVLYRKLKRRSEPKTNDLPWELRGPAQNKYGGHQMQRHRGFRGGSKLGAANAGRSLSGAELEVAIADIMSRDDIEPTSPSPNGSVSPKKNR